MPKLKCHQTNCAHNYDIKCGLECICVSKHAICDLFDEKVMDADFNQELARELAFSFTNSSTEVLCHDHECANNNCGDCILEHLRIDEVDGKPRCVNFRMRK